MEGDPTAAPPKPISTEPSKEERPRAPTAASSSSSFPAPGGGERPSHKLYVGNLHLNVTEAHLIKLFKPYGRIDRLEFVWHRSGPKRVSTPCRMYLLATSLLDESDSP